MYLRTWRSLFAPIIAAAILVMAIGCSEDCLRPVDNSGAIVINPSPDHLNAPWVLDGPEGYDESGTGNQTLSTLLPGEYTLTWGDVSGWITPAAESQTLPANGVLTFRGVYSEPGAGAIVINPSPDHLNAPWALSGPEMVWGYGDVMLAYRPAGEYTLIWEYIPGWITPGTETQTLTAGGAVMFSGAYLFNGSWTLVRGLDIGFGDDYIVGAGNSPLQPNAQNIIVLMAKIILVVNTDDPIEFFVGPVSNPGEYVTETLAYAPGPAIEIPLQVCCGDPNLPIFTINESDTPPPLLQDQPDTICICTDPEDPLSCGGNVNVQLDEEITLYLCILNPSGNQVVGWWAKVETVIPDSRIGGN